MGYPLAARAGGHAGRAADPPGQDRAVVAARIAADPHRFCASMFAELFLGPARHVAVFFSDLFGLQEVYNEPGTINVRNWTLRLSPDYARRYRERVRRDAAFNIPCALALALRARAAELGHDAIELARQLEESDAARD